MPADMHVGSFAKATGTGNQDITLPATCPDLTGAPAGSWAILFFTAGSNGSAGSWDADIFSSMLGFVANGGGSISQGCASIASDDNAGTSNSCRRISMTRCLITANYNVQANVDEAEFVSFPTATEMRLNWLTQAAVTGAVQVSYVIFTGLTNAKVVNWETPGSAINKAVTGVGFTPDLVFHAFTAQGTLGGEDHSIFAMGMMNSLGQQGANGIFVADADGTSNTSRWQRTDATLVAPTYSEAVDFRANYVSMDSDGFTVDFDNSPGVRQVISLCLKGVQSKIGAFTAGTSPQVVPSAHGFTAAGFLSTQIGSSPFGSPQTIARWGMGAFDGTVNKAVALQDLDNLGTTVSDTVWMSDASIFSGDASSTPGTGLKGTVAFTNPAEITATWSTTVGMEVVYLLVGPPTPMAAFSYTGAEQTWVVPAGVRTVTFDISGARGDGTYDTYGAYGLGGRVTGSLTVVPGETLRINCGGVGHPLSSTNGLQVAAFNGGGTGGNRGTSGNATGSGGGGATDIRSGGTGLANRVVVAGGGGGAGGWGFDYDEEGAGGDGGGTTGEDGVDARSRGTFSSTKGLAGTPSAGGAAGTHHSAASPSPTVGTTGVGGNGGRGNGSYGGGGGGGGAGYYGGGGGGSASSEGGGGGGGGGSSYADSVRCTGVSHTQGYRDGYGSVVLSWDEAPWSWIPTDLGTSLHTWYDADDASSFTLTGSAVDEWRDKSGNARHLSQGSAGSKPQRTGSINGRTSVVFDGGDRLVTASFTALTKPYTVLAVAKNTTSAGSQHNVIIAALDGGGGEGRIFMTNAGTIEIYQGSFLSTGVAWGTTLAHAVAAVFNGASSKVATDGNAWVTGSAGSTGAGTGWVVGSYGGSSEYWFGDICEIVCTTDEISSATLRDWWTYAHQKWGTTIPWPSVETLSAPATVAQPSVGGVVVPTTLAIAATATVLSQGIAGGAQVAEPVALAAVTTVSNPTVIPGPVTAAMQAIAATPTVAQPKVYHRTVIPAISAAATVAIPFVWFMQEESPANPDLPPGLPTGNGTTPIIGNPEPPAPSEALVDWVTTVRTPAGALLPPILSRPLPDIQGPEN